MKSICSNVIFVQENSKVKKEYKTTLKGALVNIFMLPLCYHNFFRRVHLKILKHVCEICSKAFVTFAVLYVHKLNHQGVRFHCFVPGCTSAVTTKDVLLLHMRNNHILSREEQEDYKKKLQEYWNTIKPKKNFIWQSS